MGDQDQSALISVSEIPPSFCQYAEGACDQDFSTSLRSDALFLYSSSPASIAHTIELAVERLSQVAGDRSWKSWKNLDIPGQIIFCEICKAIRHSRLIVPDITTLNFNLMFEIGFALGVGVPIMPIRNTSNVHDAKDFEELGLFDTLGSFDFANAGHLSDAVLSRQGAVPLALQKPTLNSEQPLYVVKAPIESDGMIKLMSVVKKSRLRFRTFDTKEVARISVHDAYKPSALTKSDPSVLARSDLD